MKNAIMYYYNLEPISIRQRGNVFSFETKDLNYALIRISEFNLEEIKQAYIISLNLIKNNISSNEIILNNNNQIVTTINNDGYVMIKVLIDVHKITMNDISTLNNIYVDSNNILNKSNWFDLWTKKIDYFEYQISQMGLKFPLIRESFSYYIGLSEIAISLVKNKKENRFLTLNHRRINYKDTTFQLYNPLNYIIDYRFRDVCEYFKSAFFNGVDILDSVKYYLDTLTLFEKEMFFARLLFPTYYFDIYEKIIQNEIEENKIKIIINKVDEFEVVLKQIYSYLSNILPNIEYLKEVI